MRLYRELEVCPFQVPQTMVHDPTRPCKDQPSHRNQLEKSLVLIMQTQTALLNSHRQRNLLSGRISKIQETLPCPQPSLQEQQLKIKNLLLHFLQKTKPHDHRKEK